MLNIKGEDASKTDWANVPMEKLALGCAMDCNYTLHLEEKIRLGMTADGVTEAYDKVLSEVILIVGDMERRGIKANTDHVKVLEEQLTKEIDRLRGILDRQNPLPNVEYKPHGVIEILFTDEEDDKGNSGFGLTPQEWNAASQLPKINQENLKRIRDDVYSKAKSTPKEILGAEFIDTYLEWKKRVKQRNDYVYGVAKALKYNQDGRIYSQYNFSVTKTGRLSNSSYNVKKLEPGKKAGSMVNRKYNKGVSFHTLPRPDEDEDPQAMHVNLRSIMGADKGKVFISGDYSAAEVRVLAHCSQDKNLIAAFESGEDLHKFTASLIFKKPINKITAQERQISKSVTFLIVYGGGPTKLAASIKKSVTFCKEIFSKYFKAFPGVPKWIEATRAEIKRTGYATSLFGRRRRLPNVNSPKRAFQERALRQGVNFVIQSSASDLMLHSIWRVHTLSQTHGIELDLVATVHDSLEIQAPVESYHKAISLMHYCMADLSYLKGLYGWTFDVPFKVDMEAGVSFGSGVEVEQDASYKVLNKEQIMEYYNKNVAA